MARSQYSLPGAATGRPDRSDPRGMSGYIRETAKKYGVDPEVALRVAKSEGLPTFQSTVVNKKGVREPSWGAFQLYTGGGLGNEFQKQTGLDPKDPANEKATIDYALKHASQHGWGPWHGAKNTGIGEFEGIGAGAQGAQQASTDTVSDGAASASTQSPSATSVAGTRTSTTTPDVAQTTTAPATGDFVAKLQDPKTGAAEGLGEAIKGLGQAVAGTGLNKDPYATAAARPTPIAPLAPPPQVAPMVDPRAAEQQRQQLALAMQRLNSGRLY